MNAELIPVTIETQLGDIPKETLDRLFTVNDIAQVLETSAEIVRQCAPSKTSFRLSIKKGILRLFGMSVEMVISHN